MCWCLPSRFDFSHGSLSFIRLVRSLLLLVLELQRWPGVCSSGSSHRSRGRLPCIIMEEQEAVVSLVLSGNNVFFQGPAGSHQVSLWSCGRCARSRAADDDAGKLLPQRFTTATGLARGSATLIARQVLANDEASEPTRIRKTRVLSVDRTVDEVSMVSASSFETVGSHCTCCP